MRHSSFQLLLVVGLGYLLGIASWIVGLPADMPPLATIGHRSLGLGAPMAALLLPTAVMITDRLLRGICVRHPIGDPREVLPIYDAIMTIFAVFVMAVHSMILLAVSGLRMDGDFGARVVPLMLGGMLMGTGNLLPRMRPNMALGIRVSHTVADRAAWLRTHRRAGYLFVALGSVITIAAIAVPAPAGPLTVLAIGPVAVFGVGYLVWEAAS